MAFEVSEPSLEHLYDHTCDFHFAPHVCVDQLWLFHLLVGDGYQLTGTKRSLDPATRPKDAKTGFPQTLTCPPLLTLQTQHLGNMVQVLFNSACLFLSGLH